MKENTKEYLLSLLQRQTPFLVSLFFIFLEHVAINFGTATIRPMFGLACVFFWLFNRPDIFGLFSAALLGICCDFLNTCLPYLQNQPYIILNNTNESIKLNYTLCEQLFEIDRNIFCPNSENKYRGLVSRSIPLSSQIKYQRKFNI